MPHTVVLCETMSGAHVNVCVLRRPAVAAQPIGAATLMLSAPLSLPHTPCRLCRDVVIPSGLVIDRRFKMTRAGKAVYVG